MVRRCGGMGDEAVEHGFDGVSTDGLASKKPCPLLRAEERVEMAGSVADAVEAAHDGSDACSHDDVRLQPNLFHHFQHADVGCALCSSATENEGDGFGRRSPTPTFPRGGGRSPTPALPKRGGGKGGPTPALPRGGGGNFLGDYKQ